MPLNPARSGRRRSSAPLVRIGGRFTIKPRRRYKRRADSAGA
jgi:hypothetical protein